MDGFGAAEGAVDVQVEELSALDAGVAALDAGVAALAAVDLDLLDAEELLGLIGGVEVVARRLDAVRVSLAGALDRSGAYALDGHRSAKSALVHLGRLSGPEAHRRVRTATALRRLPAVDAAFSRGRVPTDLAHALSRAVSNPRVADLLEVADPIFAEQSSSEAHDAFVAWLGEWERLADADGADQHDEEAHRRRSVSLVQNSIDGSWLLRGQFGALQGAVLAETLAAFVAAEDEADRADAMARCGPDATAAQWARSGAQRRADAFVAMVRAAWEGSGRGGEPLVNVVIDQATFEEMITRRTTPPGARRRPPTPAPAPGQVPASRLEPRPASDLGGPDPTGRTCATTAGHAVSAHDALAAALIGHIRRVVIGRDGRVIDLGRTRRLFSGAARDAVELQSAISNRGPSECLWSGCSAPNRWLQADHHVGWTDGGRTDQDNANLLCGHHNRLKTAGYRPVRGPDGRWQLIRPDGTTITPPI